MTQTAPQSVTQSVNSTKQQVGPDAIIQRLRGLVMIWRATYIVQIIGLLLLGLTLFLAMKIPGILALLLRSKLGAEALIPGLIGILLLCDLVSTIVERRMARLLGVRLAGLRRVLGVLYWVPGVMLVRRLTILGLLTLGLVAAALFLMVWFVSMVALAGVMHFSERLGIGFGRFVDRCDRALSWMNTMLRKGVYAIALCPARQLEREESIVLPLLRAQLTP